MTKQIFVHVMKYKIYGQRAVRMPARQEFIVDDCLNEAQRKPLET